MQPNERNTVIDLFEIEQRARQMRAEHAAAGFRSLVQALRGLFAPRPVKGGRTA